MENKIKVGKSYKTRTGEVAKVVQYCPQFQCQRYLVETQTGRQFFVGDYGRKRIDSVSCLNDLIEEIPSLQAKIGHWYKNRQGDTIRIKNYMEMIGKLKCTNLTTGGEYVVSSEGIFKGIPQHRLSLVEEIPCPTTWDDPTNKIPPVEITPHDFPEMYMDDSEECSSRSLLSNTYSSEPIIVSHFPL